MSTVRGFGFLRHVLLLALAFGGLPAHTARAADNGWFDPQAPAATANAAAAPAAESPAASAATGDGQAAASDGRDLPALAPSPLLDNRGTQAQQAPAQAPDPEETNPRALTEFRTQLDPYGTWVQHPNYGTVWVPSATVVGTGFSPYVSAGRWALDNDSNWIWVSDYPFGRVVFHYGRWVWIGGTGWAWVPGYRYAPAWVVWRVPTGSYSYVGWAPMGPSYLWYGGFAVSFWYGAYHPYYYCPSTYVFHHHVDHYVVRDPALVHHLGNNTRVYTPASARGVSARTPANPSGGPARPGGGGPAYPGSGPGRPGGPGASPALAAARVPPRSIPSERVSAASQMAGAVPRGRAEHFVSPHMDRARPSFSRSTGFTSGRSSPSGARTFDSSSPRPSFSSPRASSSGSRPSFSGSRPSFSGSRPSASFGGSRPSFSSPRPSFSGSRPSSSFSGARPTPSFSGSRPSFSGSRPSFGGGSRPSFGGGSHGSFGGGSRGGGGGGRR